jgi:hypothetical protein
MEFEPFKAFYTLYHETLNPAYGLVITDFETFFNSAIKHFYLQFDNWSIGIELYQKYDILRMKSCSENDALILRCEISLTFVLLDLLEGNPEKLELLQAYHEKYSDGIEHELWSDVEDSGLESKETDVALVMLYIKTLEELHVLAFKSAVKHDKSNAKKISVCHEIDDIKVFYYKPKYLRNFKKWVDENILNNNGVRETQPIQQTIPATNLKWNASQTDMVELVKALIENKAVIGTQTETLDILCKVFNFEVNNSDQKIQDIKTRKERKPIFLERLRTSLLQSF